MMKVRDQQASPTKFPPGFRMRSLDGDRQADLSVHGEPSKAVYVYPSEHYDYWKHELPEMKLPWGMFGERSGGSFLLGDIEQLSDQLTLNLKRYGNMRLLLCRS